MKELLGEIAFNRYEDNPYTTLFKQQVFDQNELEKALNVYGAFQRIVDRYNLCGVSVRCFDLLDTVHTTGCLGLSILNNLGVYGGCEGDLPTLLSMAILGSLTNEPLFMCNPSQFDTKTNSATFAHCTVPTTMLENFCLNTHFESGFGMQSKGGLRKRIALCLNVRATFPDIMCRKERFWKHPSAICCAGHRSGLGWTISPIS
jgi:L-fucose isomerase-like protein